MQVASQYSIPPSILLGVLRQMGAQPGMGLSPATVGAYNLSPQELQSDPLLALSVAARTLAQTFAQTGSWESALSMYLTGSADAWQSPTSSVGGEVMGILGQAAVQPDFGMGAGFAPVQPAMFSRGSAAFGNYLKEQIGSGGIVTQQSLSGYRQASSQFGGGPPGMWNTTVAEGLQAAAKNHDQSYSAGQCTFYVARSLGYIPGGLGNAADWAHNAAEQGFQVNDAPAVGTAVVWGANQGGASADGHVAVVTAVNADGTFQVSEMNVKGQWVADTRTANMNGVIGFIHPPAGTDMAVAAPGLSQTVQRSAGPDNGQVTAMTGDPGNAFRTRYATDVLSKAGLPVTPRNISVIREMAVGENMPLGGYNLLATTQGGGAPTQSFPSYSAGVAATAATLLNGNFPGLVQGLKADAPPQWYASGAGAAAMMKWQGGSTEDVGLVGGMSDPGTPPDPAKVGEFAAQLQQSGIDPQEFSQYFPVLAASSRQLLAHQRVDVTAYANVQQALLAAGQGMSNAGILAHLRGQPHPVYSNLDVGTFVDTQSRASLYSRLYTGRMPSDAETARLAGLDNRAVLDYYQQKGQVTANSGASAAPAPQPAADQQTKIERGASGGGGYSQ